MHKAPLPNSNGLISHLQIWKNCLLLVMNILALTFRQGQKTHLCNYNIQNWEKHEQYFDNWTYTQDQNENK